MVRLAAGRGKGHAIGGLAYERPADGGCWRRRARPRAQTERASCAERLRYAARPGPAGPGRCGCTGVWVRNIAGRFLRRRDVGGANIGTTRDATCEERACAACGKRVAGKRRAGRRGARRQGGSLPWRDVVSGEMMRFGHPKSLWVGYVRVR